MPKRKKGQRKTKAEKSYEKKLSGGLKKIQSDTKLFTTVRISDRFKKDYRKASTKVQADADRALSHLVNEKRFTTRMKPAKLTEKIWYIRAGGDTRITFDYAAGGAIQLRRVGSHKILKKP